MLASLACVCGAAPSAFGQISDNTLPINGVVSAGAASIAQTGSANNPVLVIQQASERAAINWSNFNIGRDASVNFQQPSVNSVILNRVLDGNPSQIFGNLSANGQVFLLNPSGIIFGSTASVDVGAIVASTHSLSDSDFMAGRNIFSRNGATGKIVNEGAIQTQLGGYIALLAPEVQNDGILLAQSGTIALAAGETVTLNFNPANSKVDLLVAPSTVNTLIENKKIIKAPGGEVIVSAQGYNELAAGVIKNSGNISVNGSANSIAKVGGRILLDASDLVVQTGSVTATSENDNGGSIVINANKVDNSGILDVSTAANDFKAGNITITGDDITLAAGTEIKAVGGAGGGTILVGGDWQGSGNLRQAIKLAFDEMAMIDASAFNLGNGGKVVLWSDIKHANSFTNVQGSILARGGASGGNGGKVETSGHVLVADTLRVDAGAPMGLGGTWLIDPWDLSIESSNTNNGSNTGGNPNTIASYGSSSVINVGLVTGSLNTGSSVIVKTGDGGSGTGVITVNAAINKTSGSDATLTLQAADNVVINQAISSVSGKLTVNLLADTDQNGNHDGSGVVILKNNITTRGGTLNFGNGSTHSINSVSTLVGGDVYVGGSSQVVLDTFGGALTVNGEMLIGNTNGLSIATYGGAVRFAGVVNSANSYNLITVGGGINWTDSLAQAKSGTGASTNDTYLATITSRLENAIANQFANYQATWLGGRRVTGIGTDSLWRWRAGPEGLQDNGNGLVFSTQSSSGGASSYNGMFNNWSSGEPNNWNGSSAGALNLELESALQFNGSAGKWNDLPMTGNSSTLTYYLKETNLAPSPLTINAGTNTVTFDKQVGNQKALGNLNITAGSVSIAGSVVTEGTQTYAANVLVAANDLQLLTRGTAASGYDILFNSGITKSGVGDASITVKSHRDIYINSNVSASGGKLNVLLDADYEDSGSGITRDGAGFIQINGNVVTNGGNVRFGTGGTASIGGVNTQVGGDVYLAGSSAQNITTGGGSLTVNGETMLANSAGLTISTAGGAVYFNGVLNSANSYQFFDKVTGVNDTWSRAKTEAKSGTGSADNDTYLATITSRLENAIASRAANYRSAWLGGSRGGATDANASDDWYWVTGPEGLENSGRGRLFFNQTAAQASASPVGGTANQGAYINWNVNGSGQRTEPNSTGEDYLQMVGAKGLWNDLSGTDTSPAGYIRERNAVPSPVTINAGTGSVTFNSAVGTSKEISTLNITSASLTAGAIKTTQSLILNNTSAVTLSSPISGTGGLTKNGFNTLTLSGISSYSGATNVNGGTLKIPAGAAIYCDADCGSGSQFGSPATAIATVNSGAVLDIANWNWAGSFGERYYDANALVINGGTLRFSGASGIAANGARGLTVGALGATFDSSTTGVIWSLDDGSGSSSVYKSVFNGNVTFTGAGNTAFAHAITGTGNLTKNGAGTLTLTGANSYSGLTTISAGTLQVGSGGTTGTLGAGNVVNNSTLSFNRSNTLAVSNVISGTGTLIKNGTGITALTAANTYTGSTTLNSGTLGVHNNGALSSSTVTAAANTSVMFGRAVSSVANNFVLNGNVSFDLDNSVEYLIAAGGGGGGAWVGGGGGGGGVLAGSADLTGSSYAISVGAGGVGITHNNTVVQTYSTAGGNSTAFGLTAIGGGSGGNYNSVSASAGGSGGGQGANFYSIALGTAGQGYAGGLGDGIGTYGYVAGGGGGAGGVGGNATTTRGGAGGIGYATTITGALSYFGGGGGGGVHTGGLAAAGIGGLGGGGNGIADSGTPAASGTANTGGGGGGAGRVNNMYSQGGAGGSGVVIARYLGASAGSGGTPAPGSGTAAGYTLHTFNSSGSLSLSAQSVMLGGVVSGSGSVNADATGGTIKFAGNNSYTGNTSISSGIVQTSHLSALGNNSAVTLSNLAGVQLQALSNLNVGSLSGGGAIGGNLTISTGATLTTGANNSSTVFSGVVSGSGVLAKSGSGAFALTGSNTNDGGITVSGGTLGAYSNNAFGASTVTAAGGTSIMFGRAVTTIGNNFTLNGSVTFDLDESIDYLITGGGGGGGSGTASAHGGGGGGGGGVLTGTSTAMSSGTFSVSVGVGGTAGNATAGGVGGSSALGTLTAAGGGGGAYYFASGSATSGASGGGGAVSATAANRTGAAGTTGFAGGAASPGVYDYAAGGGGGAGSAGGNYSGNTGGAGGAGATSSITGTALLYGGGGGGGGYPGGTGSGGGGNGGNFGLTAGTSTAGTAGSVNTGGGGGGGIGNTGSAYTTGGAGGSGRVVARYIGATAGSGGTVTSGTGSASGYTLHTFTTNGTSSLTLNPIAVNLTGAIGGAGSMTANAAGGTLTLTGTNVHTGGTTISGGVLQLGNGGSTGSLTGNIVNNATLGLYYGADTTVSNNISGIGVVRVTGANTTLFSSFLTTTPQTIAANSTVAEVLYRLSGGRQSGTAIIGGISPREAGAYVKNFDPLTNTATLQLQQYDTGYTKILFVKLTQSGTSVLAAIDTPGSASLGTAYTVPNILGTDMSTGYSYDMPLVTSAAGSGYAVDRLYSAAKITLTGDNIYSGGTTITSITNSVTSGINQYSQTIPGVVQSSGVTLGTGTVANSGVLIVSDSAARTLTPVVSGTGVLIKNGSNTLSITNTQTYTGPTIVNAGILDIGNGGATGALASGSSLWLPIAAGTLKVSRSDSTTMANAIRGVGTFQKFGANPLTLSSTSLLGVFDVEVGNLIVQQDAPSLSGNSFFGPGALTIRSSGNSFSSAYTMSGITFNSDLGSLTIGGTNNTANVTLSNAISIAGPITAYGGDITVNTDLTSTGTNSGILLKATGGITHNASKTVQTNGGDITYWSNSSTADTSTSTAVGGILIKDEAIIDSRRSADRTATNITTATLGGAITMGGSTVTATTTKGTMVPNGFALNYTGSASGLILGTNTSTSHATGIKVYSGGGDILMAGRSTQSYNSITVGIQPYEGLTVNAGTNGNLTLRGAAAGVVSSAGIDFQSYRLPATSTTSFASLFQTAGTGNVNMSGTNTTTGTSIQTAGANRNAAITFQALGTGSVTLTGNSASGATYDLNIGNANVLAASGAINLNVDRAGGYLYFSGSNEIGLLSGSGVLDSQSNVTLAADNFNFVGSGSIATRGTVTLRSFGNSFGSALSWPIANLSLGSSVSGLTIGKDTNTQNVTIASSTTLAGSVTVYGGDILVNGNIDTRGGNANGDVLLKARGDIVVGAAKTITTNGGDVILWANSDGGTSNGGVFFDQASGVTTGTGSSGGGSIWIGGSSTAGGSATWNGLTVGNGFATSGRSVSSFLKRGSTVIDWQAGVLLDETTLSSAGGNIYIAGKRNNGSGAAGGVINYSGNGTLIDAGNGTIEIRGEALETASVEYGVMTGLHPNDYTGILTLKSSNTNTTGANAITLWGSTTSVEDGILIENKTRILSTAGTSGGGISISGFSTGRNALSVGIGSNSGVLEALSASGGITVDVGSKPLLVAQNGIFRLGSIAGDTVVASSSANVIFTSNNPSWAGSVPIRTTGRLTVQPSANSSFSSTFSTTALNYTGITGLTIGSASNTGTVTVGSTTTVAGPVSIYAGDINVNGTINTSTGNANGDVLFKARGSITQAANVSVTTNGGDVIYWANGLGQTTNGSIALRDFASVSTSGGQLWMGGGSGTVNLNGMSVGNGYAVSGSTFTASSCSGCGSFTSGIYLEGARLQTGGGNITLRGRHYGTGLGVATIDNALIDSGSGKVSLEGISVSSYGIVAGIHFQIRAGTTTIRSTNPDTDAIVVTGTSGSADGIRSGLLLVEATNGGGITMNGNSTSANGIGLGYLANTATVSLLANSGSITVNASTGLMVASGTTLNIGRLAGSSVTASSSNITMAADSFSLIGSVASSGTLTLRPATANTTIGLGSGTGTWTLANSLFTGSSIFKDGFSNIIIGATNAGAITVGGSVPFVDNVTLLSGGNVTLNSGAVLSTSQSSGQVVVAAGGNFVNNAGSSALSAPGRWIVYSSNASMATFGTASSVLASGNAALFGSTYSSLAPASVATGNRYVFGNSPSVTVQTTSGTKTYGSVIDLSGQLSVSAGSNGNGAYTAFTLADIFSTLPTVTSTGNTATATVSGGPYALTASGGVANTGYTFTLSSPGTLTVTAKALSLTGLTAQNKVYDGSVTASISSFGTLTGIINSDAVSLVSASASATFADKNAASGKTVTLLASSLGLSGAGAGNYTISANPTTTAEITKKMLTVTANNDAKFAGQTDASSYAGLSYAGFASGDTSASLTTAPTVTRSNASANLAGSYTGVLVPSGGVSTNYNFSYANGNYSIVAANQMLVKLNAMTNIYGTAPTWTVAEAKYMLSNNNIVDLIATGSATGSATVSGNEITVRDAAGASATFTVSAVGGVSSTAGWLNAGSYQLGATSVSTSNGANFSNTLTLLGSQQVTQKSLTPSPTISKVYDGTTTIAAFSVTPTGLVGLDAVLLNGSGGYANKNAATSKSYTLNGLTLSGTDAANYSLSTGSTLTAANGTITARALTVSGITASDKVYDGSTTATLSTANALTSGLVAGDAFTLAATGTFADKNVGSAKTVTLASSYSGADVGNYTITSQASTSASITAKLLTLTGLTASNKVYDGSMAATISSYGTLTGIVGADAVSLVTSSASSSFADKTSLTARPSRCWLPASA